MECGFRFPLRPMVSNLINSWDVAPIQIHPHGWLQILSLITRFGRYRLFRLPTPGEITYQLTLMNGKTGLGDLVVKARHKKLIQDIPNKIRGWQDAWFWVSGSWQSPGIGVEENMPVRSDFWIKQPSYLVPALGEQPWDYCLVCEVARNANLGELSVNILNSEAARREAHFYSYPRHLRFPAGENIQTHWVCPPQIMDQVPEFFKRFQEATSGQGRGRGRARNTRGPPQLDPRVEVVQPVTAVAPSQVEEPIYEGVRLERAQSPPPACRAFAQVITSSSSPSKKGWEVDDDESDDEEGRSAPEAALGPSVVNEEDLPAAEDATPAQAFVRDPADRTFMGRDPRLFEKFTNTTPRPLPPVIDFLSSRRVATTTGLPFHMARSISDIPRAWNMDLEEMAMRGTTSDCLYMSMILSQQANVMMRRGMNLRSADVNEYLTLREERRQFEEERALGEARIKSLEDNAAEQAAKTSLELAEAEKRGRTAGLAEGDRIRDDLAKEAADAKAEIGELRYDLSEARKETSEAQAAVAKAKRTLEETKLMMMEGHRRQLDD
ncbi:hypothetical protein ACS0TY_033011 [Phlomoides rotata]